MATPLDDLSDLIDSSLGINSRPRGPGRRRNKKSVMKKNPLPRKRMHTNLDELPTFAPTSAGAQQDPNQVVLGVYGTEDWIFATELRKRYLAGQKTTMLDGTWLTEANFNLAEWVESKEFNNYTFFSANAVTAFSDDNIVKVIYGRGKINVEIYGEPVAAAQWIKYFDTSFRKAENLIEWIYDARGNDISVPLNYRPAIQAAYPWINGDYNDYIDEYINSNASVLILIGPPGTGKTTFIKNLIHRSKANAKVAYDPAIMTADGFFAGFIADDTRFLIMEDADSFLQSRTEGNTMMHKFLNVSDGLISAADKKLVFSVNLQNIGDIDSALLRPGRCFDILQFRALDRTEAQAVLDEVNDPRELPNGNAITLAEIFATQPHGSSFKAQKKMGFLK